MSRMYADALMSQNACNLSGILYSWVRHQAEIAAEGKPDADKHPVNVLFATQARWLATPTETQPSVKEAVQLWGKLMDVINTEAREGRVTDRNRHFVNVFMADLVGKLAGLDAGDSLQYYHASEVCEAASKETQK
jgi:hypothetical protein